MRRLSNWPVPIRYVHHVSRAHLRTIGWRLGQPIMPSTNVQLCQNLLRSKIDRICGVIEHPDHHYGDDLVSARYDVSNVVCQLGNCINTW